MVRKNRKALLQEKQQEKPSARRAIPSYGDAAVATVDPKTEPAIEPTVPVIEDDGEALEPTGTVAKRRIEPRHHAPETRARELPEATNSKRSKSFSTIRRDYVELIRGFPAKWKERFPSEPRLTQDWLCETALEQFLEGDVVQKVAEIRIANLQEVSPSPQTLERGNFTFKAGGDVIERFEELPQAWARTYPDEPPLTLVWVFETAMSRFLEGSELVETVASLRLEKLRGPQMN